MKIKAICFTEHGKQIIEKIVSENSGREVECFAKYENFKEDGRFNKVTESLEEWTRDAFAKNDAVVFVSAIGIAIRVIAGCVKDKLTDSPVIVIDDKGTFVIPLLSGHVGGANELALEISSVLDAIPVITTSTDSGDAFAVDLFAKENNLLINDRDSIKRVSAKSIEGKAITLSIKDYPPSEQVDVIVADECIYPATITLSPKEYVIGVGLKRGKSAEEVEELINETLESAGIGISNVGALATIDIKLDEPALKQLSQKYRIPLIGYDSSLLQKAKGEFSSSEFVKNTVGVDNVCERAAVVATNQGELVVRKNAKNGVTVAVARNRRK